MVCLIFTASFILSVHLQPILQLQFYNNIYPSYVECRTCVFSIKITNQQIHMVMHYVNLRLMVFVARVVWPGWCGPGGVAQVVGAMIWLT